MANLTRPVFKQALPAGAGPEGALAIPSRNLLVVASEEDNRGDKIRSVINIYGYNTLRPSYPTLVSADRPDGTPIPWGAMSGLAADPQVGHTLYAVEDSFYKKNRIFTIDISTFPARLIAETQIRDDNDVLASVPAVDLVDETVPADDSARIDVSGSKGYPSMRARSTWPSSVSGPATPTSASAYSISPQRLGSSFSTSWTRPFQKTAAG